MFKFYRYISIRTNRIINLQLIVFILVHQVSSMYTTRTTTCPLQEQCELNRSELMCNETMSYDRVNFNIIELKLCNFYNFQLNIDNYLINLPNIRNLTIFNSDINFNTTFRNTNNIEVSNF